MYDEHIPGFPCSCGTVERRGGYSDVEHHYIAFGRIVGHGICTVCLFVVLCYQSPHFYFVPLRTEPLVDVHVGELYRVVFGYVYLYVASGLEVEPLACGQFYNEFFYECRDIVVGDYFAFPLLYSEDFLRYVDFHIAFYFYLTGETVVVFYLLAVEEAYFGGKYFSAAADYLTFAHSAISLSAACRRKEYLTGREGIQQ